MTIKEYELPHDAIGREIGIISPHEFGDSEGFIIYFTDGTSLEIEDEPDCCEIRWMHTDDDLDYYAGSKLMGMELREGPETEDDGEHHRCMFLLVTTSLGVFTIVAHNRHNGYYAGMNPHCKFKEKKCFFFQGLEPVALFRKGAQRTPAVLSFRIKETMNEPGQELPPEDRSCSLEEVIEDFGRCLCPNGPYGPIDEDTKTPTHRR